jgi:hypothetical protein
MVLPIPVDYSKETRRIIWPVDLWKIFQSTEIKYLNQSRTLWKSGQGLWAPARPLRLPLEALGGSGPACGSLHYI